MAKNFTFFTPEVTLSTSVNTDGQFTPTNGATGIVVSGFCGVQSGGSPVIVFITKIGTAIVELTPSVALAAGSAFKLHFAPSKDGEVLGESVGMRVKPGGASTLGEVFAEAHFTP